MTKAQGATPDVELVLLDCPRPMRGSAWGASG